MGILALLIDLDEVYKYPSAMLNSVRRSILTGNYFRPQFGHKDFSLK